uniref:Putative sensor with HAMP domain protein n=1 Tax=Cyanothece sp. (strain PCC 7425 / ATCC 29141) TaxID=395961 RepID=B8HKF5_CYAP4
MQRLQTRLGEFFGLFQARLSLRIVGWIFLSLVAIESVLLVPSVEQRKQELLQQLKEVSSGKVDWILLTYPQATGTELLFHLQQLQNKPMLEMILGGAVYQVDGTVVGTFGEPPTMSFASAQQKSQLYLWGKDGDRYDVAWIANNLPGKYILVLRHEASRTRTQLFLYVLQVGGTILLISAFVTLVMMVTLEPNLITPILKLRRDLAKAGEALANDRPTPAFESSAIQRRDELGEVIATFQRMFNQIDQAMQARKQAEAELRQNNQQMQQYLQQVDRVTAAAAALEKGDFQLDNLTEVANRPDELGQLARMFQQMTQQVKQREEQLKQQLVELKIEIDQKKREQEVNLLTQESYFQELKAEISQVNLEEFWS